MGLETSNGLKWSLRVLSGISALIGIGFIIWSTVLQSPPKSSLPIGLIVLGALALILALVGIFHSMCGRCCLSIFLFFMCLLTLGELAIIISLFANLDGTVDNLLNYDISQEAAAKEDNKKNKNNRRLFAPLTADQVAQQESIKSQLEIGRYVFLVFIIIQFIVLLVTIVMRVKFPHKDEGNDFEEQRGARSAMAQIQMESLKNSVSSRNKQATSPAPEGGNFYTASNKMYKSVTKRMSQKYGEFTQDPAFQKKWWQGIPGFK